MLKDAFTLDQAVLHVPRRATLNDEIFVDGTSWMARKKHARAYTRACREREREREERRSRIKVLLRCFFVTAFALLLRSPGTMTNPRHHCALALAASRKMQKREESGEKERVK